VRLRLGPAWFTVPRAAVIGYGNPKDPTKEGSILMGLHWPGLKSDVERLRKPTAKRGPGSTMLVWVELNTPIFHPYGRMVSAGNFKPMTEGLPPPAKVEGWQAYTDGRPYPLYLYLSRPGTAPDSVVSCSEAAWMRGELANGFEEAGCDAYMWIGNGLSIHMHFQEKLFRKEGADVIREVYGMVEGSESN
jgi:hypothetical protein